MNNSFLLGHHNKCIESPQKKTKSVKKEFRVTYDNEFEKFDVLKDENFHLKTKKKELEEQVKL